MKNIYCISGLGADERIFKNLAIPGAQLVHLPWVAFDKHDEIPCYAQKMASQIKEDNPIIIGLSFGGMIAVEIAKMMSVRQVFLISSAKGKMELPDINPTVKFFVNNKLIPYGLFTQPNKILYQQFGAETDKDKEMLNEIMKDTDPHFIAWAFKAILAWENRTIPDHIIHIHGTDDHIIPPEFVNANYWIDHGSHMMIFNHAAGIASIINRHL